jgi:hypothetical protein
LITLIKVWAAQFLTPPDILSIASDAFTLIAWQFRSIVETSAVI